MDRPVSLPPPAPTLATHPTGCYILTVAHATPGRHAPGITPMRTVRQQALTLPPAVPGRVVGVASGLYSVPPAVLIPFTSPNRSRSRLAIDAIPIPVIP